MIEQGRSRVGVRCSLLLSATVLAGCASTPAAFVVKPTAEEIAAASVAGYEIGPVRNASELLAPELLRSTHHQVANEVITQNFANHYEISSDFGDFQVSGDELLRTRIHEIQALASIEEMSATAEFTEAASNALKSPFVASWNLITDPVDTMGGIPAAAWGAVQQASQLARRERGELEGSGLFELVGFESKKRQMASELGVDPYTSNKELQKQLNRLAWVTYAGAFPFMLVPFVDDTETSRYAPESTGRMAGILLHYSPEDLRRLNRIELAVMGIAKPLSDEFIRHPWYSPRHQSVLVGALAALEFSVDRAIFIQSAVTATSENEAYFYQRNAELMRAFSDRVSPVRRIVSIAGVPSGYTENNTLAVPLPADYVVWDSRTAAIAHAMVESPLEDLPIEHAELVVSGTISAMARQHIEALGIAVTDRAFDRFRDEPEPSVDELR